MAKKANPMMVATNKVSAEAEAPETRAEKNAKAYVAPSREGKKLIAGHFSPKFSRALKIHAAEDDTTIQAILTEALELYCAKKNIKAKVE